MASWQALLMASMSSAAISPLGAPSLQNGSFQVCDEEFQLFQSGLQTFLLSLERER
jgi:hypothetical protein